MTSKPKPVKAKPKVVDLELSCVGMGYRLSDREFQQIAEAIEEEGGVPVKFEREPDNPVDSKAIKVILLDPEQKVFHNWHVGYVQRPANGAFNDLLRRGASVKMAMLVMIDPNEGSGELQVGIIPPQ